MTDQLNEALTNNSRALLICTKNIVIYMAPCTKKPGLYVLMNTYGIQFSHIREPRKAIYTNAVFGSFVHHVSFLSIVDVERLLFHHIRETWVSALIVAICEADDIAGGMPLLSLEE